MKIGVLLSGCGVYDGAEIHESVLTLLAIAEAGNEAICISINDKQHHVVNHLTGEEMNESRNMLIESARIARGAVTEISNVSPADIDALVIPGGFGSAKNFSTWAFNGPKGEIRADVKLLIVNLINVGKPIVALCVSPVVLAKAMENSNIQLDLTIGSTKSASPYSISGFMEGINSTGAQTTECELNEIRIDKVNKVISAPCYMMDATILEIRHNIKQALDALNQL